MVWPENPAFRRWHGASDVYSIKITSLTPNHPGFRKTLGLCAGAIALAVGLTGPANALETHEICAQAIDQVETDASLPRELMTAISHVESGRWDARREALFAWPWAVTNGPDGQYFPTKGAAIAHVQKLQAKGIRNIDVGCMQINLRYHPDAFADLDTALDPVANADYAAKLLQGLFDANKSWGEAIRRYHSANVKFNLPYHDKVARQWNSARRVAAEEHRRTVIAEHRAQRAQWRADREAQLADARSATTRR
jgi:hypothetical protein